MSVGEVLEAVGRWPVARHVVITGGEPMVARGVRELAAGLKERGYHITIETAGTIEPGGIACDLASLSPKLAHATPREGEAEAGWIRRHEETRFRPEVLRAWLGHAVCQWKFVISGREDLVEMDEMMSVVGGVVRPWEILLMPEGRSAAELAERSAWLSSVCLERGHRFCQRLHIALYGNRRGT
jgi:7-carboxy-7-deazaguanine synthase